jgi:formylglycine-generating enzyme required for sulfatase activity
LPLINAAGDYDVFLCHNSKDKLEVKKIAEMLKNSNINPWLDEWELRPGFSWQDILENQIETIQSAAIFVGQNGIGPWEDLELSAFIRQFVRRKCPVIPVILPNCDIDPKLPIFLEGMTWVDFRKSEPDPLKQLIWGITGQKESERMVATAMIQPEVNSSVLRKAYLDHLFDTTVQVALSGIDPNIPEDAKSHLKLYAVYTALLTQTPEQELEEMKISKTDQERKLLPVLEQLERYDRLVLMGDPGGGKSTFVNFVAMCLAGEGLCNPAVNIKALKVPLPDDKGNPGEKEQSWTHGPLLPVLVILRDFAARGFPGDGQAGYASHLWDFIESELRECCIGDYAGHLKKELLEQGGLLLLDGLDEVPEADNRRGQIKESIIKFAKTFKKCRILVTSRTYAYQKQDWKLSGFSETILAPFSDGQIRQFVDRWYAHTAELRGTNREDAQGRAVILKQAIFKSDRLRVLAERPLLLTLMASLHAWRGGELPDKREQLYADATELLLETWQKAKTVRKSDGEIKVAQPSLIEWLKIDRVKMRMLLNELAYEAHAKQPELTGTADIAETDLVGKIMALTRPNPEVNPVLLVEFLSQRAGLLIPRGNGVYTFPHRTFQEYLAACYLAKKDYPYLLARLVRKEPNRWREATLLAGATAAQGTPFAMWGLVEALLADQAPDENLLAGEWGALIAGQLIAELGNVNELSSVEEAKLEQVRQRQVQIMEQNKLPAVERAAAGRILGRIGDHRKALVDIDAMEFCLVPAGEFMLGSDQPEKYNLDYDYWISRYPVTIAHFQVFVAHTRYKLGNADCLNEPPNFPVRKISWHEAVAFCDWLSEMWQTEGICPKGWKVTLPSEVEWEKAARGGISIPEEPVISKLPLENYNFKLQDNPNPRRKYPWDDEIDENRANYKETGIGDTSTVGCFIEGVSPYGVIEMCGNVWEWTRSIYKPYPYDVNDGREEDVKSRGFRVLRGGSWLNNAEVLHSSFRSWVNPDNGSDHFGFRIAIVERI